MSPSSPVRNRYVPLVEALEERAVPSSTPYVVSLYTNLLHRQPQPDEVGSWVAALDAGIPAMAVASAFVSGPEFQINVIRSSYELFLNRPPARADVRNWLFALQNGLSYQGLDAAILASDEFFQTHGNDTDSWLNAVYEQALGRPADSAGLAGWDQALQTGLGRSDVALRILTSPEGHDRLVGDAYELLLGRAPDTDGLAYWNSPLCQYLGPDAVLVAVAGSSECVNRYAESAPASGGAGTGPFFDEPICADPYQFGSFVSGGGSGSGASGGSGGSGATSGGSGGGSGGSGGGSGGSGSSG